MFSRTVTERAKRALKAVGALPRKLLRTIRVGRVLRVYRRRKPEAQRIDVLADFGESELRQHVDPSDRAPD
jgi:hypothetical protein